MIGVLKRLKKETRCWIPLRRHDMGEIGEEGLLHYSQLLMVTGRKLESGACCLDSLNSPVALLYETSASLQGTIRIH